MDIEKCYVHIVPISGGFGNYGKGGNPEGSAGGRRGDRRSPGSSRIVVYTRADTGGRGGCVYITTSSFTDKERAVVGANPCVRPDFSWGRNRYKGRHTGLPLHQNTLFIG